MELTHQLILDIFHRYNPICFGGELPVPTIAIGNAQKTLGSYSCKIRRQLNGKKVPFDHQITISSCYDFTEDILIDTVLHEMIHYYIMYKGWKDSSPHGKIFRSLMAQINAQLGRQVKVSVKNIKKVDDEIPRRRFLCVVHFAKDQIGIAAVAQTHLFTFEQELRRCFQLEKVQWYGSCDAYFNKYPVVRTPKVYEVGNLEAFHKALENCVPLVNDGRRIYPQPCP